MGNLYNKHSYPYIQYVGVQVLPVLRQGSDWNHHHNIGYDILFISIYHDISMQNYKIVFNSN